MAATAGEARKGIYRGFESTSRAGSRSIFRQKKVGWSRGREQEGQGRRRTGENERNKAQKKRGSREHERATRQEQTPYIKQLRRFTLRGGKLYLHDSKNLTPLVHTCISRGCEIRAGLVSNSVTCAEFDYAGSLTLYTRLCTRGGLTATCIRFSRECKCRVNISKLDENDKLKRCCVSMEPYFNQAAHDTRTRRGVLSGDNPRTVVPSAKRKNMAIRIADINIFNGSFPPYKPRNKNASISNSTSELFYDLYRLSLKYKIRLISILTGENPRSERKLTAAQHGIPIARLYLRRLILRISFLSGQLSAHLFLPRLSLESLAFVTHFSQKISPFAHPPLSAGHATRTTSIHFYWPTQNSSNNVV